MEATNEFDVAMMRRAIALAMRGRGYVEPNPMVGCVLVKDGRIIGEGYHRRFGAAHAEPTALANCTESPAGATAYVTLEPCCHTNKKTPPCVPTVIAAGIGRVVVGCLDPNPDVNGKGIEQLRAAGIQITAALLEPEARQLIAPFLARVNLKRPYVTLKWAETADHKIAGPHGIPIRISNEQSWNIVHELRSRCDAILVGARTVGADDPMLTPRNVPLIRRPIRVILDSKLRTDLKARLVATAREHSTLIFTTTDQASSPLAAQLQSDGVEVIGVGDAPLSLEAVLRELGRRDVTHLIVEPGPALAKAFFDAKAADRVWIFRSPREVGDATAPAAAHMPAEYIRSSEMDIGGDELAEYFNPHSPVFFSAVESADFVLVRQAAQNGSD